ncbi:hypothetical protein [Lacticaseibacillus daqingensis]|uniref:hypothetical protein n=1 Tax=Lacticaseibacillus daqingensis TaxID=2486014 RepID=UPI000F7940CF|nr:hypothetical protein [Lacticaseibacillus daqingensis]
MNKNQLKMVHYGQLVNQVITTTEDIQSTMSPKFETLLQAIDAATVAALDPADYTATKAAFAAGTAQYEALGQQLNGVVAPARLMGNHKLLAGAYAEFVAGCQAMTASLGAAPADLDTAAFDAAETAQDTATAKLMKHLQKISALA